MKDLVADFLKLFLEKYFIFSVISIVLTTLTFLLFPSDFFLIQKLGDIRATVTIFCIWFLIEYFIFSTFEYFNKCISSFKNKKYLKQLELEREKEILEKIWTKVDSLSHRDYEILMKFIRNGNKPHLARETSHYWYGDNLFNSGWLHKSTCSQGVSTQYILKDDIYQILKYSQEQFGRISHFKK